MNWILYMLFNLIFYSFLGWIIEEVYSFLIKGFFKRGGFLHIPLKPMYGITMCLLIYCYDRLRISGLIMGVLFLIVPTIVEYLTGYLLRQVFKKEYWNYKETKYNFQGLICFKFSLYWAIITFTTLIYIQPLVEASYIEGTVFISLLSVILGIFMVVDSTDTIIEGIKLKAKEAAAE